MDRAGSGCNCRARKVSAGLILKLSPHTPFMKKLLFLLTLSPTLCFSGELWQWAPGHYTYTGKNGYQARAGSGHWGTPPGLIIAGTGAKSGNGLLDITRSTITEWRKLGWPRRPLRRLVLTTDISSNLFFWLPRASHLLGLDACHVPPGSRTWLCDSSTFDCASHPGQPQHRSQAVHTHEPAPVTAHEHRVLHQAARHCTYLPGRRPASQTETLARTLTGSPQKQELRRRNVSWTV